MSYTLRLAAAMGAACLFGFAGATQALADNGEATEEPEPAAASDQFAAADHRSERAAAHDFDRLAAKAGKGHVRVIVGLQTTFSAEGALPADERATQRDSIKHATQDVLDAIRDTSFSVTQTYHAVPYVALSLSAGALRKLEDAGKAASLEEDTADAPTLAQSTPLVEATEIAGLGRGGAGQTIAILDTGVDKAHSFLQKAAGGTKVVSEACYSGGADCPGGVTSSTASGSAVPCTYAAGGCRHGTHVAGIAAGRGSSFSGVARDANLIAVQVFSKYTGSDCNSQPEDPCTLSLRSDQIKALERVYDLRGSFSIASVNMSLGGGLNTSACDSDTRKAAIDNLLSVNVATVIASGNSGQTTGVGTPGCISSAVTVGSTTKSDEVSSFSNSSSLVDLLAPGSAINSSVPGNAFAVFDGTSMATPHVAGAFAILKQTDPAATVATKLAALKAEGKLITDSRNDVVKPRIRILAASAKLKDSGLNTAATWLGTGVGVTSAGAGLGYHSGRGGSGTPYTATIEIDDIPAGASVSAAYLYWMTAGGPDGTSIFDGTTRIGTLVGASGSTGWSAYHANRTYRAVLPSGVVTGNGSHTIRGIGSSIADAQGASLVVVYNVPSSSRLGRVYIRHGALSGCSAGKVLSTTFSITVSKAVQGRPRLLGGVADGQSLSDGALALSGVPVSAPNWFGGEDGSYWDDFQFPVKRSQLPVGTTSRAASMTLPTTSVDCLAWGWTALAYQHLS